MTCALVTTHVLTIQQDVDPKQGEILFAIIVGRFPCYQDVRANFYLGRRIVSNDYYIYFSCLQEADL